MPGPDRQSARTGAVPGWAWGLIGVSFGVIVFMGGDDLRNALRFDDGTASRAPHEGPPQQWRDLLADTVLRSTDAGVSTNGARSGALHLCRDATYRLEAVGDHEGATRAGEWNVDVVERDALLTLRSHAGEVSTHRVALVEGETLVGGQPVVRTVSNRCP